MKKLILMIIVAGFCSPVYGYIDAVIQPILAAESARSALQHKQKVQEQVKALEQQQRERERQIECLNNPASANRDNANNPCASPQTQ